MAQSRLKKFLEDKEKVKRIFEDEHDPEIDLFEPPTNPYMKLYGQYIITAACQYCKKETCADCEVYRVAQKFDLEVQKK